MGRAGYFGCLIVLGVILLTVGCLAAFGATGAITVDRGVRVAAVQKPVTSQSKSGSTAPVAEAEPGQPKLETTKPEPATIEQSKLVQTPPEASKPPSTKPDQAATTVPVKSAPVGTLPPKPQLVGPESNIAQRLDRETSAGGLKLKALGAAKTTQGDRAVLAIYVRMENDGTNPIRINPAFFRMVDRSGAKYPISTAVEASLPAIELGPKTGPNEAGKQTEGNLTFELPRSAQGLALVYEPPNAPSMRIPLPNEFG